MMNRFFTLLLAAFCLTAVGQQDLWEYPFPYNPDGNQDGFIGLNDMLDLLSLYGNEFPESFYGDSSGAILNVGQMTFSECLRMAKTMGNSWRVARQLDFHRWLDAILEQGSIAFESTGNSTLTYTGWLHMKDDDPGKFQLRFNSGYNTTVHGTSYAIESGASYIESEDWQGGDYYGAHFSVLSTKQCFVVTEVLPSLEYHIAIKSSINDLKQTVNDSLENGWNLLGGAVINWSGTTSQTMWRNRDLE
jgi:hypothetical protein